MPQPAQQRRNAKSLEKQQSPRKSQILTLRRKKWILEFREKWLAMRRDIIQRHGESTSIENFLKSPKWPGDLHELLQIRDDKIRRTDVNRWIANHPWITDPNGVPKGLAADMAEVRKNINELHKKRDLQPSETLKGPMMLPTTHISEKYLRQATQKSSQRPSTDNQTPDEYPPMPVLTPHTTPVRNQQPLNLTIRNDDNDEMGQNQVNFKKRWRRSYVVNTDCAVGESPEQRPFMPGSIRSVICQTPIRISSNENMQPRQLAPTSNGHPNGTSFIEFSAPSLPSPYDPNMSLGSVQSSFLTNNTGEQTNIRNILDESLTALTGPGYIRNEEEGQPLGNYPQGGFEAACGVPTENGQQLYNLTTTWNNPYMEQQHCISGLDPETGAPPFNYAKRNASTQAPPTFQNQQCSTEPSSLPEIRELIQRIKANGFHSKNPWGDTPKLFKLEPPVVNLHAMCLLSGMEKLCVDYADNLVDVDHIVKNIQKLKRVFSRIMSKVAFPTKHTEAVKNRVEKFKKIKMERRANACDDDVIDDISDDYLLDNEGER